MQTKQKIIIVLLVLILAGIIYLIYANFGKVRNKVAPDKQQVNKNANVSELFVEHGGWGVPDGIDGASLQEDMRLLPGSVGNEVKMLQSMLNNITAQVGGTDSALKTDGIFGLKTQSLLRKYTGLGSASLNQVYSVANDKRWQG